MEELNEPRHLNNSNLRHCISSIIWH